MLLTGRRSYPSPPARLSRLARTALGILSLIMAGGPLFAQSAVGADNPSALGFSYKLPSDWHLVPPHSTLPAAKQSAEQSAKKPGEVLSVACAQPVLSAQHGKPPSIIVVVALPFSCYGQPMAAKNLSSFAAGVSDGLKQNFDVEDPVYGSYALGTHHFWIERAVGIPRNQTRSAYTLEIACTILKKSAACWMNMATDADGLRDFETGIVSLDSEPPLALVPINAFVKKNPLATP